MSLPNDLTIPDALMPFLHSRQGQPIQNARPKSLTAAAELAELCHHGYLSLEDGKVRPGQPVPSDAPQWMHDAVATAASRTRNVKSWVAARRDALRTHAELAAKEGLLDQERSKFLGLVSYSKFVPNLQARDQLLQQAVDSDRHDARAGALAALMVKSGLVGRTGLSTEQQEGLRRRAEQVTTAPTLPPAIGAMEVAIGTAVLGATLGE